MYIPFILDVSSFSFSKRNFTDDVFPVPGDPYKKRFVVVLWFINCDIAFAISFI